MFRLFMTNSLLKDRFNTIALVIAASAAPHNPQLLHSTLWLYSLFLGASRDLFIIAQDDSVAAQRLALPALTSFSKQLYSNHP